MSAIVGDLAALEALYGEVVEASRIKEVERLTPAYRSMIEAAPLAVLATVGPEGLDVSPRGDPAPVVTVVDDATLHLADRRGNNRIDSLRNIVADPRVTLIFLVPPMNETLRVIGRAVVSVEPALLDRYTHEGKRPVCVVVIAIERVFFQCGRALIRSKLWDPASWPARTALPSAGDLLVSVKSDFDGAAYDEALPARQKTSLY